MISKSLIYPCDVTLSTSFKEIGVYDLIINFSDPTSFGKDIVKLTTETTDMNLIQRIKFCDVTKGDKLLMDDDSMIEASKEAIVKVLSENGKCCIAVKHTQTHLGVQYYFEQTVQTTLKDVIRNFIS